MNFYKTYFRTAGLVAFVIFTGLIFAISYFLSDTLIKNSLEKEGSKIHGARVEIADVELSLSPLKLQLIDFQITDPDAPMQNLFEFKSADIEVNAIELIFGKVIIENIELTELQFNTQRDISGALTDAEKADNAPSETDNTTKESNVPNIDEILAKETLLTVTEAANTKKLLEDSAATLETQWNNLPDDERFAYYDAQFSKLDAMSLNSLDDANQLKTDLAQLTKDIQSDKQLLGEFKDNISTLSDKIKIQSQALIDAPGKDWDRLKNTYNFDQQGATNIASLLFGDEAAGYVNDGWKYYDMAKPWIARFAGGDKELTPEEIKELGLSGRTIYFSDDKLPAFLLKTAEVSAILDSGTFGVNISEITNDQSIRKIPTLIEARGIELNKMQSSTLSLAYNTFAEVPVMAATLNNIGWQQAAKTLVDSNDLGLTLTPKTMDLALDIRRTDETWSGNWQSDFVDVNWDNRSNGWFNKELADALAGIQAFNMGANFSGTGSLPEFELYSDLDKQVQTVFSKRIDEEKAKYEAKLKEALEEKRTELQGELTPYEDKITAYKDQFNALEDKFAQLVEEKKQALSDKATGLKNKLEENAKAEIDSAKAKAQAEADALNAKANQEKRDAENAAKAKADALKAKADEEKRKAEAAAKEKAKKEAASKLPSLF
jgi:uncharacterized protein (TIGR03545 family)